MRCLGLFVFIITIFMVFFFAAGSCPPKMKVLNRDPVCHSDADCRKWSKVCCPNQYNTKSCSYPGANVNWNRSK